LSEPLNSDATPLPAGAGRDLQKWIVPVLVIAVLASEVVLLRQNRQLRQNEAAARMGSSDLRKRTDRAAYEATLLARCRPFGTASAATPRALDVSIYFAVDRDCFSCIEKTVTLWSGAVQTLPAGVTVRGYTEIDGTLMQKTVDDLKAAFPVTNVPGFARKVGELGVTNTPVVLVSDPATGRVLMTHAPVTWKDDDRAFVERVRAAATPCG
jgi:hypothetical protein